jgi:hypothetical protein
VAPFKNATSREFRIPPPAGAGGFQFAGIELFLPLQEKNDVLYSLILATAVLLVKEGMRIIIDQSHL